MMATMTSNAMMVALTIIRFRSPACVLRIVSLPDVNLNEKCLQADTVIRGPGDNML